MGQLFVTPSAISDLHKIGALQFSVEQEKSGSAAELCDLPTFVRLLEERGQATGMADFGWRTGLASTYGNRGDVGRAVLGARTLGTALHRLVQYFPLIQDATALAIKVEDASAILSYRILDPDIWPRHQDAMYSLGIYAAMIRLVAPSDWLHVELSIEAEASEVKADLSHFVGTQVNYGCGFNALRFPAAWLDCGLALMKPADPLLLRSLSRQLVAKRRTVPVSDRTREIIYRDMASGQIGQEDIAGELGVTSRTLRRKLCAEGHSFQELLDECRMRYAARELTARRHLSLSELALRLGYAEHSTFSRAFHRWAGIAPQVYRRERLIH